MKESCNAEVPEDQVCATFSVRKWNSHSWGTGEWSLQASEM